MIFLVLSQITKSIFVILFVGLGSYVLTQIWAKSNIIRRGGYDYEPGAVSIVP